MARHSGKGNIFFLSGLLSPQFNPDAVLDLRPCTASAPEGGKALIISDLHMGDGGYGDDLKDNGGILISMLREKYLPENWNLVLNGDIEDTQRHKLSKIRAYWQELYALFDAFAKKNMFYKTLGNHDAHLVFEKNYPYPLVNAVKIETAYEPIYVYHGHQLSPVYMYFNSFFGLLIRYILRPFGIPTMNGGRHPRKRFFIEQEAYRFSLQNNCISIIAHTHRPLFKSLGRFEYIKYEIENHCRNYPRAGGAEREAIRNEVAHLRYELSKLSKSERRDMLRGSLYGDELPVPCLFNSGCAIGRKGINAIEMDSESMSLVYWFEEGRSRKFVKRGWYPVEAFPGGTRRTVLNHDSLEYINSRIELLRGKPQA